MTYTQGFWEGFGLGILVGALLVCTVFLAVYLSNRRR